jgi:hypothetical protein
VRDLYRNQVRNALLREGWRITHNALRLQRAQGETVTPNVAPLLAAEKDERKIAVAINSFVGSSTLEDLQHIFRQLARSRVLLHSMDPDYTVYLALRQAVYHALCAAPTGPSLLKRAPCSLLVFEPRTEVIVHWRP